MTIEELLELNVEKLEAMADAERRKHLEPYLTVLPAPAMPTKTETKKKLLDKKMRDLASTYGIKLKANAKLPF